MVPELHFNLEHFCTVINLHSSFYFLFLLCTFTSTLFFSISSPNLAPLGLMLLLWDTCGNLLCLKKRYQKGKGGLINACG